MRLRLTSTDMVYTPGMLVYAKTAYRSGDKGPAIDIVRSYGLPADVAEKILTGEIETTQEGDAMIVEVPDDTVIYRDAVAA